MTNEQFAALVGRLEHQALSKPNGYKFMVLLEDRDFKRPFLPRGMVLLGS